MKRNLSLPYRSFRRSNGSSWIRSVITDWLISRKRNGNEGIYSLYWKSEIYVINLKRIHRLSEKPRILSIEYLIRITSKSYSNAELSSEFEISHVWTCTLIPYQMNALSKGIPWQFHQHWRHQQQHLQCAICVMYNIRSVLKDFVETVWNEFFNWRSKPLFPLPWKYQSPKKCSIPFAAVPSLI